MTPEQLTGLAALLLEFRDWLIANYEATLDVVEVEHVVSVLALYRNLLVQEGAR